MPNCYLKIFKLNFQINNIITPNPSPCPLPFYWTPKKVPHLRHNQVAESYLAKTDEYRCDATVENRRQITEINPPKKSLHSKIKKQKKKSRTQSHTTVISTHIMINKRWSLLYVYILYLKKKLILKRKMKFKLILNWNYIYYYMRIPTFYTVPLLRRGVTTTKKWGTRSPKYWLSDNCISVMSRPQTTALLGTVYIIRCKVK